jgi:hypothetical protein
MERMLETLEVTIPQGRTLRIHDASGMTLRLLDGDGWITEEDDTTDYILGAGEARRIETRGMTLVHAFREARVVIESGAAQVELGGGYREYAAAVWMEQMAAVARAAGRKMRAWSPRFRAPSATPTIPMPIPSRLASGLKRSTR